MIDSINHNKCTGCKMCADICPKEAINFETDEQGFWYPRVAYDKCIKCGLCLKRCPSLSEHIQNEMEPEVYSAWSKNDKTRITSTSGGAFWEIAHQFLLNGGVVVGARYGKDWRSAEHIIARNVEDLLEIKGSKYFQSNTAGIYNAVKEELNKGINVLFCGTPCQIAAIKSFLGREYNNLYCMDFICRSINSPKAFKAYIDELEKKYNSKVVEVHLKNKKNGWKSLASQVRFENGEESILDRNDDYWVKGFVGYDLYTRESCYHCQYKVLPRLNSDITIGDFWGINNQTSSDMFKGISVIIINTKKGKQLFNQSREAFDYKAHSINDVIPGNPALLKNPVRTFRQDKFFSLLKKHPFSYCVNKCIKVSLLSRTFKKIKTMIKKSKALARIVLRTDIDLKKYVYYNYFCKNITRATSARIIPHKNVILDLQKTSKIILSGEKDLHIGSNKLKGSRAETYIRMGNNSIWNCNNGADIFYNTTLEIKDNAIFNSGYFSMNTGSAIVTQKNINLGDDVMMGRNIIIYDSDFHAIYTKRGLACNPPQAVNIKDHVWLTTNIVVHKGVTIGENCIISANSIVGKDITANSVFTNGKGMESRISWGREKCPM